MPNRFPLTWPEGYKRTPVERRRHLPSDQPFGEALARLLNELRLLGVERDTIIISTDNVLRQDGLPRADRGDPADPGVALYFKLDDREISFACDAFHAIRDNVRALALTIEAMRGIQRWGASDFMDRAFRGFAALPERATAPWRETFGFAPAEKVTVEDLELRFKDLAMKHHPDYGGNGETFRQILEARSIAKREIIGGAAR